MNNPRTLNTHQLNALAALVDQDRLPEAEHAARALLLSYPNAGIVWKILSVALVRQGKDALPTLRRTTELMPGDGEALRNLGAALYDQGQWALAWASLRRALELQPYDVDALVDGANSLRAMRRAVEAVPLYQRALQLQPTAVEARNNLGNAFLELQQYADAVLCYRQALLARPDDIQILCNLGNALRLEGGMDEAMTCARRAVTLDSGSSHAHHNLGLVLAAVGAREEAASSYRRALELDPCHVDAMINLGHVLRDVGQRREAASLFARAVELDSSRADSHWNLGTALFEFRRVTEAAACYRQALQLQPDYAPAHLSLALALRQQRRPAESESSCQAALALDPDYVEALSFLGELRADHGRFADAELLFEQAITLNPDFSFAYFSIAANRKMALSDRAWLKGAQELLQKRPPLGHEISLRYALGKYFDDVAQYDQAFDNYRHANELTKRYGSTYDGQKLTQRIDEIVRAFDEPFLRRERPEASTSELPVFIVGMPRSGTSLTEQILASHPAVFGAGELPFWDGAFSAYSKLNVTDNKRAELIPGMAADYLECLTVSSGGALRVIDKMPANFLHMGLIHAAFPRARIIHMRRHPLDVCLSIYFQNFFSMGPYANDFENLAHYYREYLRITDYWRAVLPATALLEVPYEALTGNQEAWSRRLLQFIGLPWDEKCLEFHQTDRVVTTASKWQVRQKITAGSNGRFHNYEKFLGSLKAALGDALDRYRRYEA